MPRAADWVLARVLFDERKTVEQQEALTTPGVSADTREQNFKSRINSGIITLAMVGLGF